MSSLLEDFLAEARELLEEAGHALLALEQQPDNADVLSNCFRVMHTLKGDSGFFDFAPMTQLVHVAEDLLDGVRNGKYPCTPAMIDSLLEVSDQVSQWCDCLETEGGLPATADEDSQRLRTRLRGLGSPVAETTAELKSVRTIRRADIVPQAVWDSLEQANASVMLVDYRPDTECFFRAEDPVYVMRNLPGLLWISAAMPNPSEVGMIDPYDCAVSFVAVSTASAEEVDAHLGYLGDQIASYPVTAGDRGLAPVADLVRNIGPQLSAISRTLLTEQCQALLAVGDPCGLQGRLQAVGVVVGQALLADGLDEAAANLESALSDSSKRSDPEPLRRFILAILDLQAPIPSAEQVIEKGAGDRIPAEDPDAFAIKVLKVDQNRIDRFMHLVGEMVVAKNSLPFLAERAETVYGNRELAREIKDRYNVLNRITQEMQDAIMEIRMLPVSNVLQRFPRLVRDVSKKLGKQIELVTEGEDTEADKNIIEALADPLVHIVRNSIDHGIESPEERIDNGKPAHGTIRIRAAQQNGRVLIDIADDGKGIDVEKVKRKAVSSGLMNEEAVNALTKEEALRLVFRSGLSTAAQISDLSGRGVGMDVVRSAIERAGGTVSLSSELGVGTNLQLSLPMSMTSSRVLVVEADSQKFGIPFDSVLETVRIAPAAIRKSKTREICCLREQTIPILRLRRLLGLPEEFEMDEAGEALLVVQAAGCRIGLIVDDFHDNVEVILKPLEGIMSSVEGLSGTALEGDGNVLLVLDVDNLVNRS